MTRANLQMDFIETKRILLSHKIKYSCYYRKIYVIYTVCFVGTMLDVWKKQFNFAIFSLRHEEPSAFVISQWQKRPVPSIYYLVYRWIITAFFLSTLILSIVDEKNLDKPYMFRLKWLIYLTNWGFTMCTVQSLLGTMMLSSSIYTSRKGQTSEEVNNSQLYKIYWATNIIATDAAFGITVLYWAIIYDAAKMPLDYLNILVHGVNSAAMFIELCVVAHPVKLAHGYLTLFFGMLYSVFSCVYYFSGGTSRDGLPTIYKVINWSKPLPTLGICVGAMFLLIVIHCCTYVMYRFRKWLAHKLLKTDNNHEKAQIPIQEIFRTFDNEAMTTDVL